MPANTIDQHRQRDQERFETNRRFEEMTDIAERLGYPIDTTINYELRGGMLYALSDTVDRPFRNQTFLAMQQGKEAFTGDQAFEYDRLRLEHEEALLVESFARGDVEGDVLVKYSKVPDAVVMGETSISGYRRDLLRSFVRVYSRSQAGVKCRLFSLDGNNPMAVAKVGELLSLDTTRPSEEVLASHSIFSVPEGAADFVDELIEYSKQIYDEEHYRVTGERTHAGSRYVDKGNAMQEIARHDSLISQHMAAISDIMNYGRNTSDIEGLLEAERKRTAAAIKLACEGIDIHSTADSAVSAEVVSGNYGRECATATGMNQVQQNMENVWRFGECQVCFRKTSVGSCRVCASCAAADERGADLLKLREHNLRKLQVRNTMASVVLKPEVRPGSRAKTDTIRRQYGEYARVRRRLVVGDSVNEVYDARQPDLVLAVI